MYCSACGAYIPYGDCRRCGAKVADPTPPPKQLPSMPPGVRKRNKFATFWLWLIIVANVAGTLVFLFLFLSAPEETDLILFSLSTLVTAGLVILILKWKKIGFFILCVIEGLSLVWEIISRDPGAVSSVLMPLILWGVLQLKNSYGVSTWDQLE